MEDAQAAVTERLEALRAELEEVQAEAAESTNASRRRRTRAIPRRRRRERPLKRSSGPARSGRARLNIDDGRKTGQVRSGGIRASAGHAQRGCPGQTRAGQPV